MILSWCELPRVFRVCDYPNERRLPSRQVYGPLRQKGPPQLNERAAEYALPRKRQEICGRKEAKKSVRRHCATSSKDAEIGQDRSSFLGSGPDNE